MKQCGKQCPACPYIKVDKEIKYGKSTWKINHSVNCETYNIIYLIESNKEYCKARYIGETERPLKYRLAEHKGYVNNHTMSSATGAHFNLPGHSSDNITITVIEKVKKNETAYRKECEKFLIRKFNTFYNGLNRTP